MVSRDFTAIFVSPSLRDSHATIQDRQLRFNQSYDAHSQRAELPPTRAAAQCDNHTFKLSPWHGPSQLLSLKCSVIAHKCIYKHEKSIALTLNLSRDRFLCLLRRDSSDIDKNRPETYRNRAATIKESFHGLAFSFWSSMEMINGPNYLSALLADTQKMQVGRSDAIILEA